MSIDNIFSLEKISNAFYKYGSLILIFGIFPIILIGANIKKKLGKGEKQNEP